MMIVIHLVFNVDIAVYSVSIIHSPAAHSEKHVLPTVNMCVSTVLIYLLTMNIPTIHFLYCESTITNVLSPLASYMSKQVS